MDHNFNYIYDVLKNIIDLYSNGENGGNNIDFNKAHHGMSKITGDNVGLLLNILCNQNVFKKPVLSTFSQNFDSNDIQLVTSYETDGYEFPVNLNVLDDKIILDVLDHEYFGIML